MEYLIVIGICIIFLIVLKFAWSIKISDIKKVKRIGYDKELNEITNKMPENKEICKYLLKKLNNEKVKLKESEDKDNKTSLYIALTNTILIANINDTFTRVQTMAHECLHSIQNRRTLLFNFFYSNIYFIYFLCICILSLLRLNEYKMMHLFILTILGAIYYAIRSYIEMDAMTKAKPLAKEYMEEQRELTLEEQNKVLENYDIINNIAIKMTNYTLIINCTAKVIIYALILSIFH
jgi:hypothetical protein